MIADKVRRDIPPWAMVPDWLIRSSVSDRAVRVFALLDRHADRDTKEAYPARATLARVLERTKSSIDRALKELVDVGALSIERRLDAAGEPTSNLYRLHFKDPNEVAANLQPPLLTDAATGSPTDAATVAANLQPRTRTTLTRGRSSDEDLHVRAFDERFWPAYPRGDGRKAALKAWLKVKPSEALVVVILAALTRQLPKWAAGDAKYIPHASTWLNGERWNDVVITVGTKKTPGRTGAAAPGKYSGSEHRDNDEELAS